jgi:flagella basal body P-ring formation protein FlgA
MITLLCALLLGGGITVNLPAQARVSGTEMNLGAVAHVQCDDPALQARLEALTLGYVPAPGFSRVLEANALVRQMRTLAPGVEIKFEGARTCRVVPQTELIEAETIHTAARAALTRSLESRDLGDCTIELVSASPAIEVPRGKQACQLEVAPQANKQTLGSTLVAVRLVIDGQTYRTAQTSWKVQAWRTQPVLLRDVRAGELIAADMIEMRRAPIDAALAASSLEPGQVMGTVAARALESGHTLLSGDLVRPTLVKKGDMLILEVRSGAVHVRTPVVAKTAGALGDRIQVVVQHSGRELNGTVVSRDTVRFDLGSRNTKAVAQ